MTHNFQGLFPALITPFDRSEEVDTEGLRKNVEFLIENEVNGLVPAASSGEYFHLSEDEWTRIVETVVDQANGRVPVVVGMFAPTTMCAIRRAKKAEDIGVQGVMILVAPYYRPTEGEVLQHLKEIAGSIDIPIVIYNNPKRSKSDLLPGQIARLVEETDNIRYMKESTGDLQRISQCIELTGGRLRIFSGKERTIVPAFVLGGKGWISTCANIAPKVLSKICHLAIKDSDYVEAMKLHYRVLPLIECVMVENRWLSLTRAAMSLVGAVGGYPRRPIEPASGKEIEDLKRILVNTGVLSDQPSESTV